MPGRRKPRLLVLNQYYWPGVEATAQLLAQLCEALARDYDVKPLWRPHWLHPETPLEGAPREQTPESMAKRERLHAWVKEMAPEQYPRIRFPERRHYSKL